MKTVSRVVFVLLLLSLLLCLTVPAAFAEGTEKTVQVDKNVIVGFEALEDGGVVHVDHKYALVTLQKRLPAELEVWLGGSVTYEEGSPSPVRAEGYTVRSVKVSWECQDNYDSNADSFRFVPVPEDLELADGLEPPVLTVLVEESFTPPPSGYTAGGYTPEIPILGAISTDGHARRGALPSYYNSFENGMLPAVRDQNPYGTCWSFSTIGAIEADLIHDGAAGTDVDLSELHLAYSAYHPFYDEKNGNAGDSVTTSGLGHLNNGGRVDLAASVLINQIGSATEAEVPYEWATEYFPSVYAGRAYSGPLITKVEYINAADRDGVKAAIMAHGGVSASIYMDYEGSFSYTYNSLYTTANYSDHAVMLVGWDDSFPKEHFLDSNEKPSADGAWLVRNSWGLDDYDRNGYFWLSYEDTSILSEAVTAFDAQLGSYAHIYAYDTCFFPYYWDTFAGPVTESQVFTVDGGERIEAVAFQTETALLDADISLTCREQTVTAYAYAAYPGIYLVQLETPLDIPVTSEVTLSVTFSGQDSIKIAYDGVGTLNWYLIRYESACGGSGLVVNGQNLGRDGHLKLYTENYDPSVDVTAANFPNPVFRAYVEAEIDTDHDTILSAEEIAAVKAIDFSGGDLPVEEEVTASEALSRTLKGLEFFPNLESLSCDYAFLEELDLSRNSALKKLSCTHSRMKSLDLSPCPALAALVNPELISVEDGALLFRDKETGASLRIDSFVRLTPALHLGTGISIADRFPDQYFRAWVEQNCDFDGDGTLVDLERTAVTTIDVSENKAGPIASLQGIELFTEMKSLDCTSCSELSSLDVSALTALETLTCPGCQLESLVIGPIKTLREINCNVNYLTALDVSGCVALQKLYCRNNELESLLLSGCEALFETSFRSNRLTEVDLSDCISLYSLYCNDNLITYLDITGCPWLLGLTEEIRPRETETLLIFKSTWNAYMQCDKDVVLFPGLPDLILPEDLTEIGEQAFVGGDFTHASLYYMVEKIAKNAFADCPNLAYIYIPNMETEIDDEAFGDRKELPKLTILGPAGSNAEAYAKAHGFDFLETI